MHRRFLLFIAHLLFWVSTVPNAISFWLGTWSIRYAQEKFLLSVLRRNAETIFGREHHFAVIHDIKSFRQSVPIRDYQGFAPFVEKILSGKPQVLTIDPLELLVPTSGSAAVSKYIPYTTSLRADFRNAIDPWICLLYMQYPRLFRGSLYASITPALQQHDTQEVVRIGFPEDTAYLGRVQQWVFETISAVPREVKEVTDLSAFRYSTLLFLVSRGDLRMLSVWHPSYLTVLLHDLPALLEQILRDLQQGSISPMQGLHEETRIRLSEKMRIKGRRIQELQKILHRHRDADPLSYNSERRTLYEAIWPELTLISCWTDGTSADSAETVKKMFPRTAIQAKGLLATEACVSIPISDTSRVLAFRSHFFEFQEMGDELPESTKLAHELERGKQYQVVVTTNGGLYRYALGDIIEVTGYQCSIPTMRFIGRGDKVVDLVGEKLHEVFVANAIEHILSTANLHPAFWMVAPSTLPNKIPRYMLFVQFPSLISVETLQALSDAVENEFRKNFHYDYARKLGQLKQSCVFLIDFFGYAPAEEIFFQVSYRLGQQLGSVKLPRLHRYEHWDKEFSGMIVR